MVKPELGKRFRCYQCGCAFYDLGKNKAICPKCGADQAHAPKFEIPPEIKASKTKEKVVIPLEDEDAIPEDFEEFSEVIVDPDVDFEEEEEEE